MVDDDAGKRVGQHRFEPVAHLDPHLALLGGDDQDRAIVGAFEPDAPAAAETIAIILDRIALQIGDGGDDQLTAGLLLQRLKLGFERGLAIGRKNIGGIDDEAGEGREGLRLGRDPRQHQSERGKRQPYPGEGRDPARP